MAGDATEPDRTPMPSSKDSPTAIPRLSMVRAQCACRPYDASAAGATRTSNQLIPAIATIQAKSRKRARTRAVNPYLDVEAEEDYDQDKEDDEDDGNSFIDDDKVTANMQKRLSSAGHTMRPIFREFDALADDIKQRYRLCEGERCAAKVDSALWKLEFAAPLWEVPVNVGKEEATVDQILWQIDSGFCGLMNLLYRVFCQSHMPGRVFVQVERITDARFVCDGIYGVKSNDIHFVNVVDAAGYLTEEERVEIPKVNTWIRMATGPYTGDLAYVLGVDTGGREKPCVDVVLLPRIIYSTRKRKCGGKNPERPSAAPLNAQLYANIHSKNNIKVIRDSETSVVQHYILKTKIRKRMVITIEDEQHDEDETTGDVPAEGDLQDGVDTAGTNLGRGGPQESEADTLGSEGGEESQESQAGLSRVETQTEVKEQMFDSGGYLRLKAVAYGLETRFASHLDHMVVIWIWNQNEEIFASMNDVEFAEDDRVFHVVPPTLEPNPQEEMTVQQEIEKCNKYLKLHVLFKKDPFKGFKGIVRTVNALGIAQVEVEGMLVSQNQLVDWHLTGLYFLLANDKQVYKIDPLKVDQGEFELVPNESRMPEPVRDEIASLVNEDLDGVWALNREQPEMDPDTISEEASISNDHWLPQLIPELTRAKNLHAEVAYFTTATPII
ncbi:hypothetical protein NP233_g10345 [Leucocoprinus birnbaumii]|uniref:Uncharacterized protein n=1 Tax=Leucocoprinus birnbaumii TaxID=56174 RepID=A0AAD5YRZ5_9AGAR|nr:hypothetical protein NP233_g10345 [Leucocoprinus birnbaumii]